MMISKGKPEELGQEAVISVSDHSLRISHEGILDGHGPL
jgi:hypothetical protein